MDKVNSNLLNLCNKRNIKPAELAKRLGVSKSTVSNWINGKSKPTGVNLAALSSFFSVDPEIFSCDEETEPSYFERKPFDYLNEQEIDTLKDDMLSILKKLKPVTEIVDEFNEDDIKIIRELHTLVPSTQEVVRKIMHDIISTFGNSIDRNIIE